MKTYKTIAMKKNFVNKNKARVKVAKLNDTSFENGIVIFIGVLLAINFFISMRILFG